MISTSTYVIEASLLLFLVTGLLLHHMFSDMDELAAVPTLMIHSHTVHRHQLVGYR